MLNSYDSWFRCIINKKQNRTRISDLTNRLYRSMKLMTFDLTKMISPKGHTDACSLVIISLISPRALSTVGDL